MATNYASATYTEIVDMQTINGKTTVIGIHTPQGSRIRNYLHGFFKQFRFFKYNGITSMVGVNAAQLPIDPLGLTGQQGTTDLMDPRDNLNPILFHGCHGEALNTVLNTIYSAREYTLASSNVDQNALSVGGTSHVSDSLFGNDIDNIAEYSSYYAALTDKSWKKFGIQSGVYLRGLKPRVWRVARNNPLVPVGRTNSVYAANTGKVEVEYNSTNSSTNNQTLLQSPGQNVVPAEDRASGIVNQFNAIEDYGADGTGSTPLSYEEYTQYMTNGTMPLGWLPTSVIANGQAYPTMLPKLFMGILVLPPSYNVEQFLRFRITHSFSFKGFTASLGNMSTDLAWDETPEQSPAYFNWIDYSTSSTNDGVNTSVLNEGQTLDVIGGTVDQISDGVS